MCSLSSMPREGVRGLRFKELRFKVVNSISFSKLNLLLPSVEKKSFEPLGEIRNLNKSFCHAFATLFSVLRNPLQPSPRIVLHDTRATESSVNDDVHISKTIIVDLDSWSLRFSGVVSDVPDTRSECN